MDENESQADSPARKPPGRRSAQHRSRAQLLLSAQSARLEEIETNLASQIDEVLRTAADTLASDAQAAQTELDRRDQASADRVREHDFLVERLRQEQEALARQREQFESDRRELADAKNSLRQTQLENEREAEQLARSRGRCQQLEERLKRESEQLEIRREQTKDQRRRIAHELKAERASQQHETSDLRRTVEQLRVTQQHGAEQTTAELKQKREEFEQHRLQQQQEFERQREAHEKRATALDEDSVKIDSKLAQLDGKSAELDRQMTELEKQAAELEAAREDLDRRQQALAAQQPPDIAQDNARAEQVRQLTQSLAEAREHAAASSATATELAQTIDELRQSHDRLRESADLSQQRHRELQATYESLEQQYQERCSSQQNSGDAPPAGDGQAERDSLIARLADAEQKLSQIDPQRSEDMERRFQMAITDVRELKRRNAELEEQLLNARKKNSAPGRAGAADSAPMDWEATKRRMLESLEADDSANDSADDSAEGAEDRLSIQNTIQITDDIVAHKDRELAELRMLLSQQSSNIGTVAVGASAIAESFDRDELIQQEREKLQQMQQEWRDKLRQAEIDISIERARIARQRLEIDEKMSAYDSARAQNSDDADNAAANQPKQPTRGRWLARLGLKDESK